MKHSSTDFARLWKYSIGFYGVWIAHIGRQMKLFDQLSARPLSIEELIINTKLYPPTVRAWCSAAQAYVPIIARNGKLQLKKQMRRMLVDKASSEYLGGQFSYLALRSLEYRAFEDLFKSGKTRKMKSTLSAVEQATDWDHCAFLAVARHHEKFQQLLSKGRRLLDVAAGQAPCLPRSIRNIPSQVWLE